MATNDYYNGFTSSQTYDSEDATGGGEQIAATVYLNETVQKGVDQAITELPPPIRVIPNEPPTNPKVDDMWIDTGTFPHTIYVWSTNPDTGLLDWVKVGITSAAEVGAYTTAQVDSEFNKVNVDLTVLGERTATIEQNTSTEAIETIMTQSQAFKDKADGSALVNYVTQSQLTQTSEMWQARFEASGGVNLLKNSVGFAYDSLAPYPFSNWQILSGAVTQYIGNDAVDAGAGFYIQTGVITQTISAVAGQPYTLTLKVKKSTVGSGYVKLGDGTTFQQIDMIATAAYDFTAIQISGFIPANNVLIIEFGATGSEGMVFTAAMLNVGELGLQWSQAVGELYNTFVRADVNGLKVFNSTYDGYTIITPQEFSGYYQNEKIFTLNGQYTEVANLRVTKELGEFEMGNLKIFSINQGGYNGWAFVPKE